MTKEAASCSTVSWWTKEEEEMTLEIAVGALVGRQWSAAVYGGWMKSVPWSGSLSP